MSDLPKPGEDVQQWLDGRDRERAHELRRTILETGRPDAEKILAVHDRNMRDISTGVMGARNCWHSISPKQAYVLAVLGTGGYLEREKPGVWLGQAHYHFYGSPRAILRLCDQRTVRALCAHELAHVDGGAFDPERRIIITERGLFVLRHGYQTDRGF